MLTPSTLITASTRALVRLHTRTEYSRPGAPTIQRRPSLGYTGSTWPLSRVTTSSVPMAAHAALDPAAAASVAARAAASTVRPNVRSPVVGVPARAFVAWDIVVSSSGRAGAVRGG